MADRYIPLPPVISQPPGDDWYASSEQIAFAPQVYRQRDFIKSLFSNDQQGQRNLENLFGVKKEYLELLDGVSGNFNRKIVTSKIGFSTFESASIRSWTSNSKVNLHVDVANGLQCGPRMNFSLGGNSHAVDMLWNRPSSFVNKSAAIISISGFANSIQIEDQEGSDPDTAIYATNDEGKFDANVMANTLHMARFGKLEMVACNLYHAVDSDFRDIRFRQKRAVSSISFHNADAMSVFAASNSSPVPTQINLAPAGDVNEATYQLSSNYFHEKFAGDLQEGAIDGIVASDISYKDMNVIRARKGTGSIECNVHRMRTFYANVQGNYSFTTYGAYFSVFNPVSAYLSLSLGGVTLIYVTLGMVTNFIVDWGVIRGEFRIAALHMEYSMGLFKKQYFLGTSCSTAPLVSFAERAQSMAVKIFNIKQNAGSVLQRLLEVQQTILRGRIKLNDLLRRELVLSIASVERRHASQEVVMGSLMDM